MTVDLAARRGAHRRGPLYLSTNTHSPARQAALEVGRPGLAGRFRQEGRVGHDSALQSSICAFQARSSTARGPWGQPQHVAFATTIHSPSAWQASSGLGASGVEDAAEGATGGAEGGATTCRVGSTGRVGTGTRRGDSTGVGAAHESAPSEAKATAKERDERRKRKVIRSSSSDPLSFRSMPIEGDIGAIPFHAGRTEKKRREERRIARKRFDAHHPRSKSRRRVHDGIAHGPEAMVGVSEMERSLWT